MKFSYEQLGKELETARKQKNLTQSELEALSNDHLKQCAISSAEHGKTRLSLDTFVEFCNLLQLRPEELLEQFLTTPPPAERSNVIVDHYVIRLAEIMKDYPAETKALIIKIVKCFHDHNTQ